MRKICVVTGSRAEYGHLYWLMKGMSEDPDISLQIVVTGMHLSTEFDLTYKVIEEDGFKIDEKIEMQLSSDTPVGIAKSIGLGVIGFADALSRLKPDLLVLLGDRFEILAAAQTAMVARIPIAHIHGGESAEGVFDEAIRHAITKMAHIHFVAAERYRKRVIQLGENPDRVYNFGAPGLDHFRKLNLLSKSDFEKSTHFRLGKMSFLVTCHSVTLDSQGPIKPMTALLGALDYFAESHIIFTRTNSDTEGRVINRMIDDYVKKNSDRMIVFTNMGQLQYLSAMKNVDVIIGNSSSGIIEAPAAKKPTVNIGSRQDGRMKALSVIDCEETELSIRGAIEKALSHDFQKQLLSLVPLYGEGNASDRIKECLKTVNLNGILMKRFYETG